MGEICMGEFMGRNNVTGPSVVNGLVKETNILSLPEVRYQEVVLSWF